MKKIYILLISISILTGCSNWLDVVPREQMREDELFKTEAGFKQSLNGVYSLMAQTGLYGATTTVVLPELIANHWDIYNPSEVNVNTLLKAHDYTATTVDDELLSTWKNYYQCIVQLNNILEHVEKTDIVFSEYNKDLLKGEALGLRAFLHLELVRYFGPIPTEEYWATTKNVKYIPYLKIMTTVVSSLLAIEHEKVLEEIGTDLNNAEILLKPVDEILFYNGDPRLNKVDDWHRERYMRFNYYAVLGTTARYNQWIGNKPKASEYAKKVIESKKTDGSSTLSYGLSFDINNLVTEALFMLHSPKLDNNVKNYLTESNSTFSQKTTSINTAYGASNIDDKRRPIITWKIVPGTTKSNLTWYKENNLESRIPIIRLSEMHLILIENEEVGVAKTYLNDFRLARSFNQGIVDDFTEETRIKTVEDEYRKDFYAQGQMFFFYKRLNYKELSWPERLSMPEENYLLPVPTKQVSFK